MKFHSIFLSLIWNFNYLSNSDSGSHDSDFDAISQLINFDTREFWHSPFYIEEISSHCDNGVETSAIDFITEAGAAFANEQIEDVTATTNEVDHPNEVHKNQVNEQIEDVTANEGDQEIEDVATNEVIEHTGDVTANEIDLHAEEVAPFEALFTPQPSPRSTSNGDSVEDALETCSDETGTREMRESYSKPKAMETSSSNSEIMVKKMSCIQKDKEKESSTSVPNDNAYNSWHLLTFNRCTPCGVLYRYERDYLFHYKEHHPNVKPYECQYCKGGFSCKINLVRHVDAKHAGQGHPYVHLKTRQHVACDICQINFSGWTAFEKHALNEHEGVKMMGCDQCDKKYFRRNIAVNHMRSHYGEAELTCKFCKVIFDNSEILKDHVKGDCGKREMAGKSENKNLEDRTPVTCSECQKDFQSQKLLDRHRSKEHPNRVKRKYTVGDAFTCPHCKETFVGLVNYQKHRKEHPGKPMYFCDKCDAPFVFRDTLKHHVNLKHGYAKKHCDVCKKLYNGNEDFQKHRERCKRKREKEAEWLARGLPVSYCNICGENFYGLKSSFRVHMLRHKHYDYCSICNDGFHRANNPGALAKHMRDKHDIKDGTNDSQIAAEKTPRNSRSLEGNLQ